MQMVIKGIHKRWFPGVVFALIFFGLCWLYGYDSTFFNPPQSVHTWRQTNGLSMTQMYYRYDLPFLEPAIQNQMSDDGLSGQTAGEFPVIYYLVARLWEFLGKSEWSFRLVHLLILFSGCFGLFRMLTPLTGNPLRGGFYQHVGFYFSHVHFLWPELPARCSVIGFCFPGLAIPVPICGKPENRHPVALSSLFLPGHRTEDNHRDKFHRHRELGDLRIPVHQRREENFQVPAETLYSFCRQYPPAAGMVPLCRPLYHPSPRKFFLFWHLAGVENDLRTISQNNGCP